MEARLNQVSDRISSLRWISMVIVVLAHAVQWPFFNPSADFCDEPVVGWVYMAVIYGCAIGVIPVFFLISGYLQFIKERRYRDTVAKKTVGLLLPLVLWTAIACLEYLALKPWTGPLAQFDFLESRSPLDWLKAVFGDYSDILSGSIGVPLLYQFWFLRDLLIISLLSPVINWLLHKIPWAYMTVCLSFMIFDIIPLVEPHSLFFYSLGGLCAIRDRDFFSITDRWIPWPLILVGVVAAVVFTHAEGIYDGITMRYLAHLPSFFLLLKLSRGLVSNGKLFGFTKRMMPQAMFLYCSHTIMLIQVIALISVRIFNVSSMFGMTAAILFIFLADLGVCTAAGLLIRRFLPKTFSLLCGAR